MKCRNVLDWNLLPAAMFNRVLVTGVLVASFLFCQQSFSLADSPVREQPSTREAVVVRQHPLTIEQSLDAFELAVGFEIELVTSEPLIIDPVTMRFDDRGRMWVVEMIDYPTSPPEGMPFRGRIKILEDLDGDGYFEKSHLFADELVFPTGIQPFRQGVIVTLAGEVAYLADTDDDGVCDQKETWFAGFSQENEQLRANHPTWTLENQVHVASGLRGGEIQTKDGRWSPIETPLSLATRDFQFDPFGGSWRAVAGNSQYGFYQDEDGRNFVCSNRNPCDLLLAEVEQVSANPLLPLTYWTVNMMPAAEKSQVFPLVDAWTTSNLHAGTFTAACGVFRYESDLLKDSLGQDFFACEPTGSLIQRYRTASNGFVPATKRAHEKSEFLASRDPWFRPVDLIDGPDGALYVVDMHRAVIEHPDWMPSELKNRADMRWGDQSGRIYRIVPADAALTKGQSGKPSSTKPLEFIASAPWLWVGGLSSPNRWARTTAARKLAERLQQESNAEQVVSPSNAEGPSVWDMVIEKLRGLVRSTDHAQSPGIPRALWLLESAGQLRLEDLSVASRHREAAVRRQAVRLLSRHREFLESREAAYESLAIDTDPGVRFQWLLEFASTVKETDVPLLVGATQFPSAYTEEESRWISQAISLVPSGIAPQLIHKALAVDACEHSAFALLVRRMGWDGDDKTLEVLLQKTSPLSSAQGTADYRLLDQFAEGMIASQRQWNAVTEELQKTELETLQVYQANDLSLACDVAQSEIVRVAALRRAGLLHSAELEQLCRNLLVTESSELYGEALVIARRLDTPGWDQLIVSRITELPPRLSSAAVHALVEHSPWTVALVSAIATGDVPWGLIDPVAMGRLERHPDPSIVERIKSLKALRSTEGRDAILARYREALATEPNVMQGRLMFDKNCANCHRVGAGGVAVGPDISDLRTQTLDQILISILDPNFAIDANYYRYSVLTLDGQVVEGLLEDSSELSVTLKVQQGARRIIARDQIEVFKATGLSMMPEGFENQMSPEAMRDLIGYLKRWRLMGSGVPQENARP